jgi:hypothetical protein
MTTLSISNNLTQVAASNAAPTATAPSSTLQLPKSATSLPTSKSSVKVDPIPLSTGDILMCAGGFAAATSATLDYLGYAPLISTFGKVATVALVIGEFYITKQNVELSATQNLEKNREKLLQDPIWGAIAIQNLENRAQNGTKDAATMVGIKWFALGCLRYLSAYSPKMQLYALLLSATQAANTVPRAIEQLKKTFNVDNAKEHTWEIARNTFVHGFNASYTLFNVGHLFYGLFYPNLPPVFPNPDLENAPASPKMPPAIEIPTSQLNEVARCKLAEQIADTSKLLPEQQNQLVGDFLKNYPWETNKKISNQIGLLFHPDKLPTCKKVAGDAFTIITDGLTQKPLELPNPDHHYNHPREMHRIAEIPAPLSDSEENQTRFACQVFDGLCDIFTKNIQSTQRTLQTLLDHVSKKWITKDDGQRAIYTHLQALNNNIVSHIYNRDTDIGQHIERQVVEEQMAFADSFGLPKTIDKFSAHYTRALEQLTKTFNWKKATEGLDCKKHDLDCSTLQAPSSNNNHTSFEQENLEEFPSNNDWNEEN